MPVAGLLLEDRDGTSGGRYSRVFSGLQASVTYHHRSFNSGDPALQNKVGHFCQAVVGNSSQAPKPWFVLTLE
jgi:hypothetical protein